LVETNLHSPHGLLVVINDIVDRENLHDLSLLNRDQAFVRLSELSLFILSKFIS
jgi:hypothetical protein